MRFALLLILNLLVAVACAASILPVAIAVAPILRSTPSVGYALAAVSIGCCVAMNTVLWRWWRRGDDSK
jgi:hypothetical protein